jgi:hypothetical protein
MYKKNQSKGKKSVNCGLIVGNNNQDVCLCPQIVRYATNLRTKTPLENFPVGQFYQSL